MDEGLWTGGVGGTDRALHTRIRWSIVRDAGARSCSFFQFFGFFVHREPLFRMVFQINCIPELLSRIKCLNFFSPLSLQVLAL